MCASRHGNGTAVCCGVILRYHIGPWVSWVGCRVNACIMHGMRTRGCARGRSEREARGEQGGVWKKGREDSLIKSTRSCRLPSYVSFFLLFFHHCVRAEIGTSTTRGARRGLEGKDWKQIIIPGHHVSFSTFPLLLPLLL